LGRVRGKIRIAIPLHLHPLPYGERSTRRVKEEESGKSVKLTPKAFDLRLCRNVILRPKAEESQKMTKKGL
jgi:hypothetical protein